MNRTVLDRQLLLQRRRLTPAEAVERVAGLQSQYAPTAYIGLWSRLQAFGRNTLTTALEERSVVQGTLMRSTIHVVSAADYRQFAAAVRHERRDWWKRVAEVDTDLEAMATVTDHLLEHGPLKRTELVRLLEDEGYPRGAFNGVGLWLDLIRVPPSGTWERRRADLFQTAARWLGPIEATPEEGLAHLAGRYLGGFGPAAPGDIASFCGVRIGTLRPVLERMQLVEYEDPDGEILVDLPDGDLVDGDVPAPVRFLGPWEAVLLVHARRSGVLPEDHRPLVFSTKNPHSVGTYLVDGRVAGAWRLQDGDVSLEPFETTPAPLLEDVEAEAEALAAFVA